MCRFHHDLCSGNIIEQLRDALTVPKGMCCGSADRGAVHVLVTGGVGNLSLRHPAQAVFIHLKCNLLHSRIFT